MIKRKTPAAIGNDSRRYLLVKASLKGEPMRCQSLPCVKGGVAARQRRDGGIVVFGNLLHCVEKEKPINSPENPV